MIDRILDAEHREYNRDVERLRRAWQRLEDHRQRKIEFLLGLVVAFFAVSVFLQGCAHDPASRARQTVTGMYAAIGACSAAQIACDAVAQHFVLIGNGDAAKSTVSVCGDMNKAMHVLAPAADAASAAIDAAEKIGAKDYTAALLPALQAGCALQTAAEAVAKILGHAIPVVIPCGGG